MSVKKWIMKQYWRVGQIRVLTALATGMLVLGRWYYGYIPILQDLGIFGALILGAFLFSGFLAVGWIYDIKARMWSQHNQVIVERSPYQYVSNFKNMAFDYPFFYAILKTFRNIMVKLNLDTSNIDDLAVFMNRYFSYRPDRKDIDECDKAGDAFLDSHKFDSAGQYEKKGVSLWSKAKLAWELSILRLNWIQSLTGLIQDTLVFGILYVLVVFPFVTEQNALIYAILGISTPMFIALVAAGWLYDKKLRVWSVDTAVKVDRNPYSYVMEPKLYAFTIPFVNSVMETIGAIMDKLLLDRKEVDSLMNYLDEYITLSASRNQDLAYALKMRQDLGTLFQEEKEVQ